MNAGIMILQDGKTPCIVYDEQLPFPIDHVEFSREDYQLTLVFKTPEGQEKQGRKLEYPLDHRFVNLLKGREDVATARIVKNKQVSDLQMVSIVFIDENE